MGKKEIPEVFEVVPILLLKPERRRCVVSGCGLHHVTLLENYVCNVTTFFLANAEKPVCGVGVVVSGPLLRPPPMTTPNRCQTRAFLTLISIIIFIESFYGFSIFALLTERCTHACFRMKQSCSSLLSDGYNQKLDRINVVICCAISASNDKSKYLK